MQRSHQIASRLVCAFLILVAGWAISAERINHEGRILGPAPTVTAPVLFNTPQADAVVSAMQIFPVTNAWNEDISTRPLLSNSTTMINQIISDLDATRRTLRIFQEMNYVLIPDNQPGVPISITYADESDPSPYPIPSKLPLETWPTGTGSLTITQWQQDINNEGGDRHGIMVMPNAGDIWETWATKLAGTWQAGSGAKFNLFSNAQRPLGWTSADASGMAMFGSLVRYDECERGMVEHAMRIIVKRTRLGYIYPASHNASVGSLTDPNIPAMGQRVRLKASFAIPTTWTKQEKAIALALKKYGALVADNGGFFSISICPDNRFPAGCFNNLNQLAITNFEVIQTTGPTQGPRSPGAPTANAGADQTVSLGSPATLSGTVTGTNLTTTWYLYSGPGTVSFANASAPATTATFSAIGTYTLMLRATDGIHEKAFDAVMINVTSSTLPTVTITASDASAGEAASNTGTYTITRTGSISAALTISVATSGSAVSGSDYTALPASVTIPAGSASTTLTLTPVNDSMVESTESATLSISASAAYTVGSPASATVTIADDDKPVVSISATDSAAAEAGLNSGTFTLTRTGSTAAALTVSLSAGGTATSSSDYNALPTTATIAAGSATATVSVSPINDALIESSETVIATVTASAAYIVGSPASATVNIADNDTQTVSVIASDASASETLPNNGTFTITRTGDTINSLIVNFTVAGTSTVGSDYNSIPGSVTLGVGATSATVTITPINDTIVESTESVVLTISTSSTYNRGATYSATVNIADNDTVANVPPTVSVTAPGGGATFVAGATITVSANATDSGGSISKVDFFANGALIGTDTLAPYSISWSGVAAGNYALTARATDNLGAATTSAAVNITVNPPNVTVTLQQGNAGYTGWDDTWISEDFLTGAFGSSPDAHLQYFTQDRQLHRASLASIPLGSTVVSARLQLYAFSTSGTPRIDAYRAIRHWDEATATWQAAATGVSWAAPGLSAGIDYENVIAGSVTLSAVGWISIDITTLAGKWVNGTVPNEGVVVRLGSDGHPRTYCSEYTGNGALRPRLIITYTPPPSDGSAAAAAPAFDNDSDGDALTDDYEVSVGLDPNNPDTDGNGTGDAEEFVSGGPQTHLQAQEELSAKDVGGGAGTTPPRSEMVVAKVSGSKKFSAANKDAVSLSGTIPATPILDGAIVRVDAAGFSSEFTLDKRGRGKNANGTLTTKNTSAGLTYKLALKNIGLTAWDGLFDPAADMDVQMPFTINIEINGAGYTSTPMVALKSRAGKAGKFRN
jgi:hypothetical protein